MFYSDTCASSLQVYLFAEALAEGAVKMGMPSALAHSIASQTVLVSLTMCTLVFHKSSLQNSEPWVSKHSFWKLPCAAGCWEIVTWFREASGSASLWGLHAGRNNHLRAARTGTGQREGVDHECCGVCHRESQGTRPQVSSGEQEVMHNGCLYKLLIGLLTWKNPTWHFFFGGSKNKTKTELSL